ncbi:MAG: hypothetical protein ACRCXZ_08905 [Patescibacteria group bacterium]
MKGRFENCKIADIGTSFLISPLYDLDCISTFYASTQDTFNQRLEGLIGKYTDGSVDFVLVGYRGYCSPSYVIVINSQLGYPVKAILDSEGASRHFTNLNNPRENILQYQLNTICRELLRSQQAPVEIEVDQYMSLDDVLSIG